MMGIIVFTIVVILVFWYLIRLEQNARYKADRDFLKLAVRVKFAESREELSALLRDVVTAIDKCKYIDMKIWLVAMRDLLRGKLSRK